MNNLVPVSGLQCRAQLVEGQLGGPVPHCAKTAQNSVLGSAFILPCRHLTLRPPSKGPHQRSAGLCSLPLLQVWALAVSCWQSYGQTIHYSCDSSAGQREAYVQAAVANLTALGYTVSFSNWRWSVTSGLWFEHSAIPGDQDAKETREK
jgi:hypothetical protein